MPGLFAFRTNMPPRTKSPCRHRGCRALVDKPGYCAAHAKEAVGWNRQIDRGSRHERGYDSAWDALRLKILRRDRWLCKCETCASTGRIRKANEVDHIVPKTLGGTDESSNLRSMHPTCHQVKTDQDRAAALRARTNVVRSAG